jgi:hypothetical protein
VRSVLTGAEQFEKMTAQELLWNQPLMREVPKVISPTLRRNTGRGTRLIAEPNRKNDMNGTMGNPQGSN